MRNGIWVLNYENNIKNEIVPYDISSTNKSL
jgi:hypothetical protein